MPNLTNYFVEDTGLLRLICPLGGQAGITGAWISAASFGPNDTISKVEWWAQTDEHGSPTIPNSRVMASGTSTLSTAAQPVTGQKCLPRPARSTFPTTSGRPPTEEV